MNSADNMNRKAGKWGTILMALTLFFSSCVKDKYDEPPTDGPFPDITANITIRDLKNFYTGTPLQITDDLIIEGVVVADDRSGNFYKTMVIQDSTAGISVRLDRTNLFTDYPVGRKVYIKCKGLYLGAYRNLIQLGGGLDLSDPTDPSIQTIASLLIDKFVVKGPVRQTVTPIDVEIEDLFTGYQNMLIRIKDVQFIPGDTGVIYANAVTKQSINRTLQNCSGRTVVLRTSGYAAFASELTPSGNGTITAVYQVFGTTNQLYVRDLSDIEFSNARCQVGPIFSENFNSGTAGNTVSIPGWLNIAQEGTKLWLFAGSSSDKYASFNPFPTPKEASNIVWLITPEIVLDATKDRNLNFRSYIDFPDASHTPGEVFVTTNYSGDPLTTTWVKLSATFATGRTWTSSGPQSLSAYKSQNIRIGFKYTGSGTDNTKDSNLQIDNITVE
jgi:hypothetical protein